MNSLTNEDFKKEIYEIANYLAWMDKPEDGQDGWYITFDKKLDNLTALFNKHIDYIIGDDMEHQDKEPSYVSKIIDNVNKLKRNQRTRAGIHTKGEES